MKIENSSCFTLSIQSIYLAFIFCQHVSGVEIRLSIGEKKIFQRYEKIEFALDVGKTFANPYNTGDEDVYVEIKKPDGKSVKIPAFYMQRFEFEMRPRGGRNYEWLYPDGNAKWFARYVCDTEGEYSAIAVYNSATSFARSEPIKFKCVGGNNNGFIRVARDNPQYFEFDSGRAFFPYRIKPRLRGIRSIFRF